MPKQIQNPGTPESYVDGLRTQGARNSYVDSGDVVATVTESGNPTYRIKGVDTRLPGPVGCLAWLAVFAVGVATGAVLIAQSDPTPTETAHAPTVSQPPPESRNTKPAKPAPKPTLSAECQRTLDGMEKYLDSAVRISDAGSRQHDILSEAYTAILAKDWKKLNDLSERQFAMERELVGDKARVLPEQQALMKDLATCRSQLNSSTR